MPQPMHIPIKNPAINGGQVRVNISALVNSATIRHEKRNGRDVIIVPSATLPDDVVMNGIKYPAAEIAKSFETLERTFAPLGHPMAGNNFISARDPEAINGYHVGAWNENVRRENGRVFLDKVIDVEVANRTEKGRALIEAINKKEPIETSTGVFLELDESTEAGHSYVAKNMQFDHDAILIGEEGAARPSQGVGMMVNKDGAELSAIYKGKSVLAINSYLDCYENGVEWAAKNLADSIEQLDKAQRSKGLVEKIMSLLKGIGVLPEASGLNNNHAIEDTPMDVTKEEVAALAEQVKTLATNADTFKADMATAIADAIKPVLAAVDAITANKKAEEEVERTALTAKVVANGLLDEEECKILSINSLRKFADKAPVKGAAPIFTGNFSAQGGDSYVDESYNPNLAINAAMGVK